MGLVLVVSAMLLCSGGAGLGAKAETAGRSVAFGPEVAAPTSDPAISCPHCVVVQPTWVNVTPSGPDAQPPATFGGSAAWDPADDETVYFGGNYAYGSSAASNSTWVFAHGIWTNITNPLNAPPARSYATMDYDANMGGVLMFGGQGPGGTYRNDTWLFHGGSWTNVSSYSAAPPGRVAAAMAFDPQPEENGSVLFGGFNSTLGFLNDTWIWTGGAGWVKLTRSSIAPPELYGPAIAYDATTGYVVEYGGLQSDYADSPQTWELYSGEWWNATGKGSPPAEHFGVMTYDPSASGVLLFGGYNESTTDQNNKTWLFDNGSWSERSPAVAPPQLDSSGFALAANGTVPVLVDGSNLTKYGGYNETWAYEFAPTVSLAASAATAEVGEPVTFTATIEPGTAPYRETFNFGDGTDAVSSGTDSSPAALHTYTTPGTYLTSVDVTDAVGATTGSALVEVHVNAGPAVRATATPVSADVGTSVSFVTNVTSAGTAPLTFAWTFGDGGTSSVRNATHTYTKTGTFNATVTATDADQASSNSTVVVTVVGDPSVSAAIAPHQPYAGEMARFYANVSGGTGPYTYSWLFDDHTTSSLPDPVHEYNSSGTYTVQLWVNDSGGGSTHTSMTVTVGQTTLSGVLTGAPLWFWGGIAALAAAAVLGSVLLLRRPKTPRPAPPPVAAP